MARKLCVAAAQMALSADVSANVRKIRAMAREARERRAQLVVFPECAISGYPPTHLNEGQELDGEALRRGLAAVQRLARDLRLMIAVGTCVLREDGWYNVALLIDSAGEIVGEYAKTHLTAGDKKWFRPGNALPVFRTRRGTFGMQICFDGRFPEVCRLLRERGAEVVLHLVCGTGKGSSWKAPVWEGHTRSRCAENGIYMVCSNAVDGEQMMYSLIGDPRGLVLARANLHREEVIVAELDLSRREEWIYNARRTDLLQVVARDGLG